MNAKLYEFPDLTWHRKMFILLWAVFASAVTAVFLVTVSILILYEINPIKP